ncbi:MAG TPA: hypothetical protein QF604_16505 [Candidatus Latescibacteria bacterium]|jgi:hypothetical protein|nr:hypothetical protein [Rhodospirillaceae bacterium]HJN29504.1 hypothetical protein [Candidatus Latescibacterota bacterium]|tara:strand:- start:106 stop:519 length:414 start_codon:yes stop_codon:yes gene_type:complete
MGFDYEKIMSSDKVHDDLVELIDELISSEATAVLSLGWDSNRPGGSGAIWITEWRGMYFMSSSDYDPEGPFSDLDEVLEMEQFGIKTPMPELESSSISEETLRAIALGLVREDGDEIWINQRGYVQREGTLVKQETV